MDSMSSVPSYSGTLGVFAHLISAGGDKRVEEEVKKEKMVTATKKGAAVLDQHIPDHIKTTYHVLQVVGGFIYLLFSSTCCALGFKFNYTFVGIS
jgi:hypothetical protein